MGGQGQGGSVKQPPVRTSLGRLRRWRTRAHSCPGHWRSSREGGHRVCLSKVYLERDGERRLLAEDVASIDVAGDMLRLKTLFGDAKEVGAQIREIDFLTHSIVLEELKEKQVL